MGIAVAEQNRVVRVVETWTGAYGVQAGTCTITAVAGRMAKIGVLLLNLTCACTTFYGLYRCTRVVLPANLAEAGHKQFLTNIAAVLTIVTGSLNVVNQLLGGSLDFCARELLLPVALCLETIVCLIYWPLRLFFIHLIMHGVQNAKMSPLPLHADIAVHLLPVLYLAFDYFVLKPEPFVLSTKKVLVSLPLLGLAYRIYLGTIIDTSGSYPYPFLDVDEPYKSIVFVVVSLSAGGFYSLYQRVHSTPRAASAAKQD